METNKNNPKKPQQTTNNSFAKYGAMGFQMAAMIGLGVYGGLKLDEFLGLKKFPAFTLLFSLLGVFGAMYYFIKDFLKKK